MIKKYNDKLFVIDDSFNKFKNYDKISDLIESDNVLFLYRS